MKSSCFFSLPRAIAFVFIFILPLSLQAQVTGPERVLIRNAILMDPGGVVENKLVNILINQNKLELVTEDKISRDEVNMVVNANKGFVLGRLELGAPPNFLIFDEDPRENFEVMKDTYSYSVLVIDEGVVVKNRLMGINTSDPDDEPKKAGWLAYTPPPFMVPLNYQDASKSNQFDTEYVNGTFISLMVMDRMNWLSQDESSKDQLGDLSLFDGGEIRAFRFGFIGTLNFENPWVYTLFVVTQAFDKGYEVQDKDNLQLYDYRLDIPFFKNSVMSIGKQKEPISMNRLSVGTL